MTPTVYDNQGNGPLRVGDRVKVEGAGFEKHHLGTVEKTDGVNVCVRIDGLLGNPYWFTAAFDGVIEDLQLLDPEGSSE